MSGFLKSLFHRMSKNTKIIRSFSKQLKRKQIKYTTPIYYLTVLEVLKKNMKYHGKY